MSDIIEVVPTNGNRQGFARWSLAQRPGGLAMVSHEAWAVPTSLFADVPAALLEGAYIDGHVFRPALAGFEPDGDGYKPADLVPVNDGAQPEAQPKKTPARRTRKTAQQTSETAAE